jgi:RHS repeat-associated protein
MEALERRILLSDDLLDPSGVRRPAAWVEVPTARTILPARHEHATIARSPRPGSSAVATAFSVQGTPGQVVRVTFDLLERSSRYHNEVGLFRVDDPSGRIGRLMPSQPGYAAAALERLQVLFTRDQKPGAVTTLDLPAGGDFGMYLIQNSSNERWVRDNPRDGLDRRPLAFFSFPTANPDRFRHLRQPSAGVVTWEDMTHGGDRDFNDAVVRMTFLPASPPAGTPNSPNNNPASATVPVVTILAPSPGLLTNGNVTIVGQVTDSSSPVRTLRAHVGSGAPFDVSFDATGSYQFTTALPLDGSADGIETVTLQATDEAGNTSQPAAVSFTLDTTPPPVTFDLDPASDTLGNDRTTLATVTLDGQTEPDLPVVLVSTGATTTSDSQGRFSFTGVGLVLGANALTVRATDPAGNVGSSQRTITLNALSAFCPFSSLDGWTVQQTGGSPTGQGTAAAESSDVVMREGDSLLVTLSHAFTVPATPSHLEVEYSDLSFDATAAGQIKDAFEAAFVDGSGNSLVHTIGAGRDSYFNVTEGLPAALAAEATTDGTAVDLDLSGIAPGTTGTLALRLVNNDGGGDTSVRVPCVELVPGSSPATPAITPSAALLAPGPVDTSSLSDVTASFAPVYGQTSFDQTTNVLSAGLTIRDVGTYSVGAPLLVGVRHLSDPTVRVRGADGTLPDGTPFYNFTNLLSGSPMASGGQTDARDLTFADPSGTPFTYDLVVLAQLDRPPAFTTQPNTEAIPGVAYTYGAAASDPDGDPLQFSLLAGPSGMKVDAATGQVTWSPQPADLGTHDVALRVSDGRGGTAEQDYTIDAIAAPPDRPPVFTSTPVVDANANTPYSYPATARDPDADPLAFSVVSGPQGLTIDPTTGLVNWTPAAVQLGVQDVTLQVDDGRGGTATQAFAVGVAQEAGNGPPVIISTPPTQFNVEVPGTPTGVVTPDQISLATGEQSTHHVTVQVPTAPGVGSIDLQPTSIDASAVTTDPQTLAVSGTVHVAVRNNGPDPYQSSVAGVFDALVFEDRNGNAIYDPGVDNVLGDATFAGTLAAGASTTLDVSLSGIERFRDDPLHVMVNSTNAIPETDETNNTLDTGVASQHQRTGDWLPSVKWQWNPSGVQFYNSPTVAPLIDTNGDGRIDARDVPAVVALPDFPSTAKPVHLAALRGDNGQVIFDVPLSVSVDFVGDVPTVGDLDGDGRPEILLQSSSGNVLYCFNNDGTLKWTSQPMPDGLGNASPVLVDLDGDGKSEILFGDSVLNSDGTLRWNAGKANPNGIARWTGNGTNASSIGSLQAADLNLDGIPEIVAGPSAFDKNGKSLWSWEVLGNDGVSLSVNGGPYVFQFHSNVPLGDAWTTVARLDSDPHPEIIAVRGFASGAGTGPSAGLWIFRHDGSLYQPPVGLFQNTFNAVGQILGPPTVGDFDGDGKPEIALVVERDRLGGGGETFQDHSGRSLYVFKLDGTEVWHKDLSPGYRVENGSTATAFDFDGDGDLELVVQDQQYLYILDGRTGAVRFQFAINNALPDPPMFPAIADVDNDGAAEIVATASQFEFFEPSGAPSTPGIYVFGDANDNWGHARRSWNQWMYHPAFTSEDGSVPTHPLDSWDVQNGLRTQLPLQGVALDAAPDLSVSLITVDPGQTPASATITARIGNGGSLQAGSGVTVDFYLGNPAAGGTLLGNAMTVQPLFPGGFEDVSFVWNNPTAGQIVVTVNEAPLSPPTPSSDLALLPNTWADASGYIGASALPVGLNVFNGIDGVSSTNWLPASYGLGNSDPGPPFYTVHFPFPVNASSVTIQNTNASGSGFLGTGTLTFSNGFTTTFDLGTTGAGTATFPEQQGITWVKLTSSATASNGASLSEFIVGGTYLQPSFLVVEGDGRMGNNRASLVLNAAPGALADPSPVVNAGPDQTGFVGDAVMLSPATFTDPVLLETHTATIDWGDANAGPGTVQEADGSGSVSGMHHYAAPGTYKVTVTVRDSAGDSDSATLTVKVLDASLSEPPIDVAASDPSASLVNLTGPLAGIGPGQTAAFDVKLTGPAAPTAFDLLFVRPSTGALLGSIPVVVNETYTYQVRAVDGDGDPLTFGLPTAPAGAVIDPSTGLLRWTPNQAGTYNFEVEVSDGRGGTATQSYQLTVTAGQPNQNPVISSTPPSQAFVFRDFAYPVVATDPDGDLVAYFLTSAPPGMAIDAATGRITWRPDLSQVGTATVTVSVRDPRGGSASQTFTLNVTAEPASQAPAFSSTPITVADSGQLYQYMATATNAVNDPLTYDLSLRAAGMAIDPVTGLITWIPDPSEVGVHDVIVRVRDPYNGVTLQHFQVTVRGPDVPPVITSTPPTQAVQGAPLDYRLEAQDVAGDHLTYHLDAGPAGASVDAQTGVLGWTPTADEVGAQSLSITVKSDRGGATTQTVPVQVVASAANDPPRILSTPRAVIAIGGRYAYQVQAIDPDFDPLTFTLTTAPAGMTVDASGLVTWQPTGAELGANPVVLTVDDGRGGSVSQSFSVDVVSQLTDQPPSIVSTPPLAATVGRMYAYDARATDPENDPVMWSFDAAPTGMTLDPRTGTIRWTPTADEVGLQTAVLRVTDDQGGSVVQSIPVIVYSVDVPPVIISTPPTQAYLNTAYEYQVEASDVAHLPLTFSLSAPPAGMTIDAVGGLIRWTPTAAEVGPQTVTIQVGDGQGGTAVQTYTVVVAATPPDQPPVITSKPVLGAVASALYQYQVTASDPEHEAVHFALPTAPDGMTIDASTGLIQWTPTPAQAGGGGQLNFNLEAVQVTATDTAGNAASQRFTITLHASNDPPAISSQPVNAVTPGALYGYDVKASDPDGDPLTYHLDTAPQGMTIDDQGRIRWSPSSADIGDHPVALTVSDGLGGTAPQSFTVTVGADTEPPRVSLQLSPNPVDVGTSTMIVVSATDDVGVQSLILTIGGTPLALDPSGRATIPMKTVGQFDVVATATDAAGNTGKATGSLLVIDPTIGGVPTVSLASLPNNGVITAPIDVIGTASDRDLLSYSLDVGSVDGGDFHEVAHGTSSVTDGVLGQLDPTMLANDNDVLRLVATNAGGKTATAETNFSVMGNLKLGNFTLSFTDLTVPVSGIPITVTRTYDTLSANQSSDFGYGWRLEYRDVHLRTSVPKTGDEADGLFNPLRDGTRVYLTLPGKRREGFTFRPIQQSFFNTAYFQPSFVADPGVTDTLSVQSVGPLALFLGADSNLVNLAGTTYNPADPLFGGNYFVTATDGTKYEIDGLTGLLTSVTDLNGNSLSFSDAGIQGSTGAAVTFARDPQGRITLLTDPMGNQVQYQYDPQGDLVAVVDQVKGTTHLTYSPTRPHYLQQVTDPDGQTGVRTEYDAQGRMARVFDTAGNPIDISYDPSNSIETVKDKLGNATTYQYDDRGNIVTLVDPLGNTAKMSYDQNNDVLSRTDAMGTTTFTYDAQGNLLSETDLHAAGARASDYTTTFAYDALSDLTSVVLPTGAAYKMTYDSSGNRTAVMDDQGNILSSATYGPGGVVTSDGGPFGTTSFTYDSSNNPIQQTDSLGTRVMTYYANGQLATLTDPNHTTATYQYDAQGRQALVDYGNGITVNYRYNASSTWTSLDATTIGHLGRQLDANGQLTGWVLPDGSTVGLTRDADGRTVALVDAMGNKTAYGYDADGNVTSVTDATGGKTTMTHGPTGMIESQTDPLGNTTHVTYAPDGSVASVTDELNHTWTYHNTPETASITDPLGRTTTVVSSPYGLPTEVINPDGTTMKTTYLGTSPLAGAQEYPTSVTDQAGRVRTMTYNADGQLQTAADLGGNKYTYGYSKGDLTSVTGPTGEQTTYSYYNLDLPATVTYPDGSKKSFTYDSHDLPATTTLPTGDTVTYTRDAAGRVTSQQTSSGDEASFTYNANGEMTSSQDAAGTTNYKYDAGGNLIEIDAPDGSLLQYRRDPLGRVAKVTAETSSLQAAYVTTYGYDQAGNLSSIVDPLGGKTVLEYDADNRLVKKTLPNGMQTAYTYDGQDRLGSVVSTRADGTVIASAQYVRSPSGEPTKITWQDGSYAVLGYDASLRLAQEAYYDAQGVLQQQESYTYDAAGNRIAAAGTGGNQTYDYKAGDRLVQVDGGSQGTETYGYDTGDRATSIQRGSQDLSLGYDAYDHLTSVKNQADGTQVQYVYDAGGNLIGTRGASGQADYLVGPVGASGSDSPYLSEDGSGNLLSGYVYAGDQPIMRFGPDGPIYYLTDGIGSVVALADAKGATVGQFAYDAFGNLRSSSGPAAALPAGPGGDFRFQANWLEAATGLYNLHARDYDPHVGRFLTRDPAAPSLREPERLNPYAFANSNPELFRDPNGMEFDLISINISQGISDQLDNLEGKISQYTYNYLKNKVKSITGNLISEALKSALPAASDVESVLSLGSGYFNYRLGQGFGETIQKFLCNGTGPLSPFIQDIWFEAKVGTDGTPLSNGLNCAQLPDFLRGLIDVVSGPKAPRPDFIIKQAPPTQEPPLAFLIGDIKLSLHAVYQSVVVDDSSQWEAISNFAEIQNGHEYGPLVAYIAFLSNGGQQQVYESQLEERAIAKGVVMVIITLA